MSEKKHLASTTDGLFDIFNQILKEKGISTAEMPFYIKKIQFELKGKKPLNAINTSAANITAEKKCIKWESKLIKKKDPHTGKVIVQLEQICVKREG